VHLLVDLAWQCWIFPPLLVAVWLPLWFVPGRGRLRMWYAGLSPFAAAGVVLGIVTIVGGGAGSSDDSCGGPTSCAGAGQAAHWAYGLASISDIGMGIIVSSVIAAAVSLPLLVITAAVELPRLAAAKEAASSPHPRPDPTDARAPRP